MISLTIDWFDLLAVQGTLKSLLQHHSSKASVPQCSVFFMVQLSQPYMTTGKILALTIRTLLVMSLLFNMLSRLVIAFLPKSKCLLISWLQSPSAVIFEPKKNKVCHCSHCFPIYAMKWWRMTGGWLNWCLNVLSAFLKEKKSGCCNGVMVSHQLNSLKHMALRYYSCLWLQWEDYAWSPRQR